MVHQPPAAGPEAVVRELYDLVTFGPGDPPDWDAVRALFVPEAVVVLRAGDDRMDVLTLDGFVQDFVDFIEASDALAKGFTERILGMESLVYGDVAHVLVHFDSALGGSERPPSDGLDSIQLVRKGGRWLVACIVNERPRWAGPVPILRG